MDIFGIGAAVRGMVRVYQHSARSTGRTTTMIESLKSGDRVVFKTANEAKRVQRLCKERGLDIDCVVVAPKSPQRLVKLGPPSKGRTIFDHSWVEEFYILKVESAQDEIDYWQRETSGYGEAHLKTKRQAEEILRWRV